MKELLAQPTASPGATLGATVYVPGYAVLEELGRGGMGRVYKARQLRLGRLVALKVVLAGQYADAVQLSRFQNEAETVARLQHPNIVQIHEVGEHNGLPYLALEFLDGGSLADRLNRTSLPAAGAAELIEILARAAEAAHAHAVIHRDLKPANVLLTADGVPKISDFGLAKQLDAEATRTQSGAILGTPSYMAPEQAAGRTHEIGPPADVYALGAILYEAMTGRPPFRSASVLETLEQVRTREPLPPRRLQPRLPRDLQTICLKCLEKDPRRRYSSALALAEDLARFRRGEPVRARPVGPVERLLKWARRRPALAALGSFSLLAVLVLVVGGLVYHTRLVAALHQAERNETRADAGYQSARAAMQTMLSRLQQRKLAEVPQVRELQRQLYEDALGFYREILKYQDDPDPAVRLDVGVALRETGILQHQLGQTKHAEENYRQSVAVLERLTEEHPDKDEYQGQLAATCNNLASLLSMPAQKDEVERWHQKALALREGLHRRQPDDPQLQKQLAETYHNLGALDYRIGRDPMPHWEKALELSESLVRVHPANSQYAVAVAETCTVIGLVYQYRGSPDRAEESYRKAEALLVPAARDHPENLDCAASLAAVRVNWGMLLQNTKRHGEAIGMYDRAVSDLEGLLRKEPNLLVAQDHLLNAHGGRAQTLAGMGRFAEAIPSWDRVVELGEKHPNRNAFRLERALTVARSSKYAQAVSEADEYARRENVPVEWLYHLVCVYARASETAGKDEELSAEEQLRLGGQYATKAVKMLARAREAGYFSTPQRRALLRGDSHLKVLHQRTEYQQMQRDVEKEG